MYTIKTHKWLLLSDEAIELKVSTAKSHYEKENLRIKEEEEKKREEQQTQEIMNHITGGNMDGREEEKFHRLGTNSGYL